MKSVDQQNRRISKRMSFWLRHQPKDGGLTLDSAGWTEVSTLLQALQRNGSQIDLTDNHVRLTESVPPGHLEFNFDH